MNVRIHMALAAIALAALTPGPSVAFAPLKVSANGRYLERPNGKPFFFLSDTEWPLNAHTDAQVKAILDDRKRKGFTVVQVFGAWNAHKDANGNLPFVGSDPTRFNTAYWDRWRWIADQAAQRGLLFLFIYGDPGRGDSQWKVHDAAGAYAYGRLVGKEFADKKNIIFCNGQDIDAAQGIGPDGWRAMAKGVADGVNGKVDGSLQSPTDYSTTTMTFHGFGISKNFHNDTWIDFYGPEVWHDNSAVYDQIHGDYELGAPVKPVVLLEGSYEDETSDHGPSPITPHYMRVEAWRAFFSGAAGYSYGNVSNWAQISEIDYINSVGSSQMAVLAKFMTARKWWQLAPDQDLIEGGGGSGADRLTALRAVDGSQCCIHFPAHLAAKIRMDGMSNAKIVQAVWLDPRTGFEQTAGKFKTAETPSLTPPDGWEDAILILSRSGSS